MHGCSDLIEGLAVLDDVEAPARAIVFWNIFETVEEDVVRAGRNVKLIRNVAWGCES